MEHRGLNMALVMGLLAAASACASGDGVPTAAVENGLNGCMVEASYLGYRFTNLIGPSGRMPSREVVPGTGVAYAVVKEGVACTPDLGDDPGGTLYVTTGTFTSEAGQLTRIPFNDSTAREVPVDCNPAGEYVEGIRLFTRLAGNCQ